MILRVVLIILSSVLLSAHFLREGEILLTAAYLFLPLLLLIKRRWVLIVLQIFTYGGVLVWFYTLYVLINERMSLGIPWVRMAIILAVVIIITLISGLLLNSKVVKEKYKNKLNSIF